MHLLFWATACYGSTAHTVWSVDRLHPHTTCMKEGRERTGLCRRARSLWEKGIAGARPGRAGDGRPTGRGQVRGRGAISQLQKDRHCTTHSHEVPEAVPFPETERAGCVAGPGQGWGSALDGSELQLGKMESSRWTLVMEAPQCEDTSCRWTVQEDG